MKLVELVIVPRILEGQWPQHVEAILLLARLARKIPRTFEPFYKDLLFVHFQNWRKTRALRWDNATSMSQRIPSGNHFSAGHANKSLDWVLLEFSWAYESHPRFLGNLPQPKSYPEVRNNLSVYCIRSGDPLADPFCWYRLRLVDYTGSYTF